MHRLHAVGVLSLLALSRQASQPPPAQDPPQEASAASEAEEPESLELDDGWFDMSSFLEHPAGFLPVAVPITEPALGYGLAGGMAFLDPREDAGAEGWARPNVTFVGGLWTEDGSEGLFAANSSTWAGGDLQTLVGAATVGLELSLHGIGEDGILENDPLEYRLDVDGVTGEGRQRLGETDFWLGLRFSYARATVDFDGPSDGIPGVDPEEDDTTLAGPALTLRYDSLDNLFTPTIGGLSDTSVSAFDESFGGSRNFQLFQQVLIHHWRLSESFFLGARGQWNSSFGDTPFYARPYVLLRGVPLQRYQGEHAASAELELRWQFHQRISLVGFGGAGLAWNDYDEFENDQSATSGGMGLRYLLSRKFGLHAGLDVARGPEESVLYVQIGNAWMRP